MEIANHVVVFGGKEIDVPENLTVAEIKERAAQSEVSIVNQEREQEIKDYIDQIKRDGDTIGGLWRQSSEVFQLAPFLCPMGQKIRCQIGPSSCLY